jgi:hypothetical protein
MLVCVDLSSLYFAIREINITVNYESLIEWLRSQSDSEDAVEIHAFSIADPKNQSQTKFLKRLEGLGVTLHIYDFNTKPNFSVELGVWAALSDHEKVMIISNDSALLRAFSILEKGGKKMSLSFFSEKLNGNWTPKILSGEISFLDLSSPETRAKISS